jgi:uncharacterized membrane protein YhfC
MDTALASSFVISGLIAVSLPLAIGLFLTRKYGTSWRVFNIGCFMFIASLVRIPLNQQFQLFLNNMSLGGLTWVFAIGFPSLTAGIFEEVARYTAFRYLVKEHTINPGAIPPDQLAAIEAMAFYMPFVGLYERLMAITVHLSLSVMVLLSFRTKNILYLVSAVLVHFLLNFVALSVMSFGIIYTELVSTVFALILGYWLITHAIPSIENTKTEGV